MVAKEDNEVYSCICGYKTESLPDFRRHLIIAGKQEPGRHKSSRTKGRTKVKDTTEGISERLDETAFMPSPPPKAELPSELTQSPSIQIERGGDGAYRALIPEEIVGKGIPFKVTLSVRTIAYYQIAAAINPGLSLGDFIDQCVHDTFEGRGLSLGLVKLGG
jgi:hypothetical protein